jgi:molybdenum cofactor cytidylyltransferase
MKFGPVPVAEAVGAIVVHSVRSGDLVVKKGMRLDASQAERLAAAGVSEIVVARLDADDLHEDEAAARLAAAIAGEGVRVDRAVTGRANLFAERSGLLVVDASLVDRFNTVDEAVTVATLPAWKTVEPGEMIGTVKIIPFAVPKPVVEAAEATVFGRGPIRVAAFLPLRVAVVSTLLSGLKPSVVKKTLDVLAERLAIAGGTIVEDRRVPHDPAALKAAVEEIVPSADLVIVFGASAITDRRDVIPAALEAAGGRIEHFGMPVDPGNLLLVGSLDGKPFLGAPGCARSPKENGFDWVLQRLMARIPVTKADITRMGVGGLLMEIVQRGRLRDAPEEH